MAQSKAYLNTRFLESRDARALRILAEYLEPLSRFQRQQLIHLPLASRVIPLREQFFAPFQVALHPLAALVRLFNTA